MLAFFMQFPWGKRITHDKSLLSEMLGWCVGIVLGNATVYWSIYQSFLRKKQEAFGVAKRNRDKNAEKNNAVVLKLMLFWVGNSMAFDV